VEGACLTPVTLHASCMNLDMNRGSQSLITLVGKPKCANTCFMYNAVVSSAVMSLLHSMNIAALVQPWSVIVSIELKPCETGRLTMKFNAIVSNGIASSLGYMGCRGALVGRLLTLWCWQSAHPLTYSVMSCLIPGHQWFLSASCIVLLMPGWLYTGES
jgi:hypothetical protein